MVLVAPELDRLGRTPPLAERLRQSVEFVFEGVPGGPGNVLAPVIPEVLDDSEPYDMVVHIPERIAASVGTLGERLTRQRVDGPSPSFAVDLVVEDEERQAVQGEGVFGA